MRVYQRDASWYARPNVRSVKVWHAPGGGGGVAACDRHVLLNENTSAEHDELRASVLCQRRACQLAISSASIEGAG